MIEKGKRKKMEDEKKSVAYPGVILCQILFIFLLQAKRKSLSDINDLWLSICRNLHEIRII